MTKTAALYAFFSSFSLPAYPSVSVPSGVDAPSFPYLTYDVTIGTEMDKAIITASLWYRETELTRINAKADEISRFIGNAYALECDDGGIIIRRGTPFSQLMDDPADDLIKRKVLNLELTFCTPY